MKCRSAAKVWLELPSQAPRALQGTLDRLPKNQGTINARFTGIFRGPSAFGDGGYQYQLELEHMTEMSVVSKQGFVPDALSAKERERVCH